jgi:hypothetical protein
MEGLLKRLRRAETEEPNKSLELELTPEVPAGSVDAIPMNGGGRAQVGGAAQLCRCARIAALLLLFAVPLLAAAPSDPLWQKAVEIGRRNRDWLPGEARFVLELIDENGTPKDSWESWYRLSPGADGKPVLEVVRELRNGVEVTPKESRRPFSTGDDPFDPGAQESVQALPRGQSRLIDGALCSLYEFTLKKKDGSSLVGTAWLNQATGVPVEASYTYVPLPKMVFEMNATLRYGQGAQGEGALREVHIEGSGGVLFIRRNFRSTITLDAYRPYLTSIDKM